jgi:tRNA threonylcarbamoyl adenosine modification protein (Sua5/YciO/YrdC/YwlC family)
LKPNWENKLAIVLKINPENPQGRLIKKTAETLNQGGIIVYPTDTVYGIGCDIFNKKAIDRIYQLKGKERKKPLSFIVPNLKDISTYAQVSDKSYRIMRRVLPGPYTFVLPATKMVPKKIAEVNKKTVGIRVPDNITCQMLLAEFGNPIISTSANLSGEQILDNPDTIHDQLGKRIDLILDGGILGFEASTVVDLTADDPTIIRQGKGDFEF